ncbi:MAG: hypothetical protein MPEBLZ_02420 [Candidatus Methanoperedens nitroreducens]|uniref:Uncharacterized protein n=1 Tax=Candidatus Methanoperedens nitratireducens TaxID=1392998 RepID=A0A0P8CJE3_9EURY|nr:hypothetical protein [Candidatus Methanoperedens sp. BLZ2]KAB2945345.1 MAG: hypothetical protein F9K14_11080 [Candidatus Methanoperedens sp.]KPQ43036.1 MAG: hypothetical protein MPEBLZ_02420 [Candidatus Methanoperedens sp. BLZ1]MBZ0176545.1 hypothetical protein [Candidatus Methanoperedens nitroreducens]CAG0950845.1 hypothetical protein METP2_00198 [Methanosarcinales archaeon]MCX9077863.1 hypothetical protein [Candidatus Methanoperedens sp.]
MMSLLVFLVLLFGLFGVISSQYIIQYREAYALWIKEIVYSDPENNSDTDKKALCSKVESYSREICELTDMILLIFILISATFLIIVYTIEKNMPLINPNTIDYNILIASRVLTFMLFSSLILILYFLKINIIFPSGKTSAIDEKLFSVWYKYKCYRNKQKEFLDKLEPRRLYEILAEKIENGELKDASQDDILLIEPLFRSKKISSNP